jgi:HK97 gp10 family phage protein
MIKGVLKGQGALRARLNKLVPSIEKYAAEAKLAGGDELALRVRNAAPTGETLDYMESIQADFIKDRPAQEQVGVGATKDEHAVGLFAKFTWRFLEFGTKPHNVTKGGGTVAGKKQVSTSDARMHPGSRPYPHIFTTYRAMKPKIRKRIRAAVNKAIRESKRK